MFAPTTAKQPAPSLAAVFWYPQQARADVHTHLRSGRMYEVLSWSAGVRSLAVAWGYLCRRPFSPNGQVGLSSGWMCGLHIVCLRMCCARHAMRCASAAVATAARRSAMSDASYTPCYFESHVAAADGSGPEPFEWKAWVYSSDRVMWELRRPVIFILQRCPVKLSSLLKRDLSEWCDLCSAVLGAGSITLSARQVICRTADADNEGLDDPLVRQEHSCSTPALLLFFAWWRMHRRRHADRERCLGLAVALLDRLLSAERQLSCLAACPATGSSSCTKEPIVNGVCLRLHTVARTVAGLAGDPGRRAIESLGEMLAFADCEGVAQWVTDQLDKLGSAIDAAVRAMEGCSDPLQSKHVLVGKKKNLRIDEDVKTAYFEAVRDGRAHSVESLQSALDDPRGKAARNWIHERMQVAMAAGWVTGARGGCFSIAADGSRFGNPAEETVAYAWWHPSSSTAGWLPVQAGTVSSTPPPPAKGLTAVGGPNSSVIPALSSPSGRHLVDSGCDCILMTRSEQV